jgi:RNA-directed DNA polymerase
VGQADIQEAASPSTASDTLDRTHLASRSAVVRSLADGSAARLHDGSCLSRETHVQFCEGLGVQFPGATHRNIYVRSERAGQRVMKSITKFITQKLKLRVHESKSAVAKPQERKFLGFSFTDGPEIKRAIAPKSLVRFKRRVRGITRCAKGISIDATMTELVPYMWGWRSYFGCCETPRVLAYLTSWVRAQLRVALWRQWKTPPRRRAALLELGASPKPASHTAGSSRGPWYLAHAKALSVALPTAYFKSLGLPNLPDER